MRASPQLEDGYTRVANELMEAFASTYLTTSEFKTLFAFLRRTYGWHKKKDMIPITQFQRMTKLGRQSQVNALKGLVQKAILVVQKGGLANVYSLQKDYLKYPSRSSWTTSPKSHKQLVQEVGQSKDRGSKDIYNTDQSQSESKISLGEIEKLAREGDRTLLPYQAYGLEMWEKLGAPPEKKAEFIRIARDFPEGLIFSAFQYAVDYPVASARTKIFFKVLASKLKGRNERTKRK